MLVHTAHALGEGPHHWQNFVVFEIAHHRLAILDRREIADRTIKERGQMIVVFAGGDRGDDLVEVQIAEELRLVSGCRLPLLGARQ